MSKIYDVIILGAGPAGLAAGLYAGRSMMSTLILEKGQDGGQIAQTSEIENYPGQMLEDESGTTLVARMAKQAKHFGAERVRDTIKEVTLEGGIKKVIGTKGEYLAGPSSSPPAPPPGPSAVKTRNVSPAPAFPTVPPATVCSSGAWRSSWWAAATRLWRKPSS